jgi:hypothetical protein
MDYEVELAIVIGKPTKNVSEDEAMEHVLGYTIADDLTARKHQAVSSQWGYAKGGLLSARRKCTLQRLADWGRFRQLLPGGTCHRLCWGAVRSARRATADEGQWRGDARWLGTKDDLLGGPVRAHRSKEKCGCG